MELAYEARHWIGFTVMASPEKPAKLLDPGDSQNSAPGRPHRGGTQSTTVREALLGAGATPVTSVCTTPVAPGLERSFDLLDSEVDPGCVRESHVMRCDDDVR